MSVDSFARWAGESAAVSVELGAQLAYRALLDLLAQHDQQEAIDIIEAQGPDAIAAAWSSEAWRTEENPTAGQAEPTTTTTTRTTP